MRSTYFFLFAEAAFAAVHNLPAPFFCTYHRMVMISLAFYLLKTRYDNIAVATRRGRKYVYYAPSRRQTSCFLVAPSPIENDKSCPFSRPLDQELGHCCDEDVVVVAVVGAIVPCHPVPRTPSVVAAFGEEEEGRQPRLANAPGAFA